MRQSRRKSFISMNCDLSARMYIGNWSDYEAMMQEKFGEDLTPHCVKYRTLTRQAWTRENGQNRLDLMNGGANGIQSTQERIGHR